MPLRIERVAKNTSANNDSMAKIKKSMAPTKLIPIVMFKFTSSKWLTNKAITTVQTSNALNTLKLKEI